MGCKNYLERPSSGLDIYLHNVWVRSYLVQSTIEKYTHVDILDFFLDIHSRCWQIKFFFLFAIQCEFNCCEIFTVKIVKCNCNQIKKQFTHNLDTVNNLNRKILIGKFSCFFLAQLETLIVCKVITVLL